VSRRHAGSTGCREAAEDTAALSEHGHGSDPAVIRTADGSLVVDVELGPAAVCDLRQLIADARAVGADSIWLSGDAVDAALGFERAGGYARLEAAAPPTPIELPSPPPAQIRELQILCFAGVWGHHEPANVNPSTTFVGLHESDRWVGICEVDTPGGRIVDPGLRRGLRTPDRYTLLVRGAAARLAGGPVTLETWGDSEATLAAYQELGFSLAEYIPGWQLNLRT
jgi:hypothetical protein